MIVPVWKKRQNLLWLGGIVVLLGISGASYVLKAKKVQQMAAESADASTNVVEEEARARVREEGFAELKKLRGSPHIYYRSVRPKEFGRIVVASLAEPEKMRFVSKLECNRAYFDDKGGVCLVDNRAQLKPPAYALLVDERFEESHRLDLAGFPSRTRLSPDGRYAASTVFTMGEDYEAEFTTRTMVIDRQTGKGFPDLEKFTVYQDGKCILAEDFNFWGITFFNDSNKFHATLRTGDKTFLLLGDLEKRSLTVLKENVECPSLSPDQKRIAFKKLVKKPGEWRVHVMELATLKDRPVSGEERSIDDQIEWLDDEHILYGTVLDRGAPEDAMNVWRTPVGGGERVLFLKGAASPSVVR